MGVIKWKQAPMPMCAVVRSTHSRCLCLAPQASGAASNSYHVLQYNYVPDILEKRGPYREQHLARASKMVGLLSASPRQAAAGDAPEAHPAAVAAPSHPRPVLPPASLPGLQAEQNKLVMAGALTEPVDGAIFIFRQGGGAVLDTGSGVICLAESRWALPLQGCLTACLHVCLPAGM